MTKTPDTKLTISTNGRKPIETTVETLRDLAAVGIIGSGIIKEMTDSVEDLTFQNWPHISRIMDTSDSAKIPVSFSFEIDRSGPQVKVTTKISYAEKFKDERESYIDDPNQTKMEFAGADK